MAESTNMSRMPSERAIWQGGARRAGSRLEREVRCILVEHLADMSQYKIDDKPTDLKQIYRDEQGVDPDLANRAARTQRVLRALGVDPDLANRVVRPQRRLRALGVEPDLAIRNRAKGTKIWVEIKWQKAEGNAHERACKYFAPGLVSRAETLANVDRPFYFIFAGGMVDTPGKSDRYHAEIDTWFDTDDWRDHVLKWVNHDREALREWFEQSIRPALG